MLAEEYIITDLAVESIELSPLLEDNLLFLGEVDRHGVEVCRRYSF